MSRPATRRLPLAGATLALAAALSACGGSGPTRTASAASDAPAAVGAVPAAPPDDVAPEPPAASATPSTVAPRSTTPTTPAPRATTPSMPATTVAAPPTTAAPVAPKFAPGQRINPTSAQVQAAISALTQRIPLFKPTDPQLRTFADAACTSFDQGQSQAQVQATVQQAVTYVQGASLSSADAEFAVRTVVSLRCPGYLP